MTENFKVGDSVMLSKKRLKETGEGVNFRGTVVELDAGGVLIEEENGCRYWHKYEWIEKIPEESDEVPNPESLLEAMKQPCNIPFNTEAEKSDIIYRIWKQKQEMQRK